MELIKATDLKKSFYYPSEQLLFEKVSFSVNSQEIHTKADHIGLIGNNGVGKSTLLNIIIGKELPDNGFITYGKKNICIGYLEQDSIINDNNNVYQEALNAVSELAEIQIKLTELEATLQTDYNPEILEEYGNYTDKFNKLDGFAYLNKVEKCLSIVGLDGFYYQMPVKCLSGGEKAKLKMAKLLVKEPDILLLDEPTNHLDLNSVEWLEDFLLDFEKAFIVISHDRAFLDKVCNKIYDLRNEELTSFSGNYSNYVYQKKLHDEYQQKQYEKQQKRIDLLKEEAERKTIWANRAEKEKKGALDKGFMGHKAAKIMKKAMNAKKRIEMIIEKENVEKPKVEAPIRLKFYNDVHSPNLVARFEDLSVRFDDRILFDKINLTISKGDKISIIGDNGSGKTTLLNIIGGIFNNYTGDIKLSSSANISYYTQNFEALNHDKTVIEELSEIYPDQRIIRNRLAASGIKGDNIHKKIENLSFGEKSKVMIVKMILSDANLLLLDEPTNNLDIFSIEALEEALIEYSGTIVIATHDRYFANKISSRIIKIEEQSLVELDEV